MEIPCSISISSIRLGQNHPVIIMTSVIITRPTEEVIFQIHYNSLKLHFTCPEEMSTEKRGDYTVVYIRKKEETWL